ncbi:MAG: AAA family ATPase [Proteobacteria bacterium]|nr:AAA family ATPase [Pseudomonadota bacterium]
MKIDVFQDLLLNLCMKQIHMNLLFIGPMGVGKTWCIEEVAESMNVLLEKEEFGFVDLRLANNEPGDIIGFPREKNGVTFWTRPEWFPKPGTRGLLLLGEINRAPIDVRQAVFSLLSERRLHTHKLPDGWIIVGDMNPDNGEYQVDTLDKAMNRRFCQIVATPDALSWCKWAKEYGVDKKIIQFINENKKMLYKEERIEITAFPTPEGYRLVDEILTADVIPSTDDAKMEVISGIIGEDAAVALAPYLVRPVRNCVTAVEILEDYANVVDDVKEQSNDRMNKTIDEFTIMFSKDGEVPETHNQLKNLIAFMCDLPAEWLTTLLIGIKGNKKLLKKCGEDRRLNSYLQNIKKQTNATNNE